MIDSKDVFVPLIQKVTNEKGLLFATQKTDGDATHNTTRTWGVNKALLEYLMEKGVTLDDISKVLVQN